MHGSWQVGERVCRKRCACTREFICTSTGLLCAEERNREKGRETENEQMKREEENGTRARGG